MKIYDLEKHNTCFCREKKERTLVDVIEIEQDQTFEHALSTNEILFIIKGRVSITLRNSLSGTFTKGEIVFLPMSNSMQCKAINNSELLFFRLYNSASLCYNFSLDQLSNQMKIKDKPYPLSPLKSNARLLHFAKGVVEIWRDGFRCKNFFKAEISKLLTLLPIYYAKNELYHFYYPVLNPNATFSEQVRLNHLKYRTINELAISMNLTPQQFTRRFISIFGQNPHQWIQREKARLIYAEIKSLKPLKKIAAEFGFTDQANFNRFCKAFFDCTPGEIRHKGA